MFKSPVYAGLFYVFLYYIRGEKKGREGLSEIK